MLTTFCNHLIKQVALQDRRKTNFKLKVADRSQAECMEYNRNKLIIPTSGGSNHNTNLHLGLEEYHNTKT